MAATKTPRDHKQPKDKPRTITVMGATLTIDPAVFDDLDMVELLYDMQHSDENPDASFDIVPFLRKLCCDDYPAVKQALRDPDTGRIGFDKVGEFTTQVIEAINPNSSRS